MARFVVCGYSQRAGVDYEQVWAPTPATGMVRALLAVVAERDWDVHVMDVKRAFLNPSIDKDLFIKQAKGFESGGPLVVCRLLRAMYGAKQATMLGRLILPPPSLRLVRSGDPLIPAC